MATLGGLGAPFVLHTGTHSVTGLVTYTALVIACATGMFMYGGWRRLLAVIAVGGGLATLMPWWRVVVESGGRADAGAIEAGLLVWWAAVGLMPMARLLFTHRGRPLPSSNHTSPAIFATAVMPVLVYVLSWSLWEWTSAVGASLGALAAAVYGLASMRLRAADRARLAAATDVATALLLALAIMVGIDDPRQAYWLFAVQGAGMHVLARRLGSEPLASLGHAAMFAVTVLMAGYLLTDSAVAPLFVSTAAVVDLLVVAALASAGWTMRGTDGAKVYLTIAYCAALAWFWHQAVGLPNGHALISTVWGMSSLAVLGLGWRRRVDWLRRLGLATLVAVVIKLFAIDLAELDAMWRVALFLGFGGVLLVLSYVMPRALGVDDGR